MRGFIKTDANGNVTSATMVPDCGPCPEDMEEVDSAIIDEVMCSLGFGKTVCYTGKKLSVSDKVKTKADLADEVRAKRDSLLRASDWTQLQDVPDNIKKAWTKYREALWNLDLESPVFPDPPKDDDAARTR